MNWTDVPQGLSGVLLYLSCFLDSTCPLERGPATKSNGSTIRIRAQWDERSIQAMIGVDQLQTWATHIPQVFSGYVACSKSPINMYICNIDSVHTYSYILYIQHIFCLDHMSRLQTQGPGGHPPWSMRRLLCQVFYFLKWENQWNPHIKHAYSIHIYIHTGTYRYIQIHYIYYIYI